MASAAAAIVLYRNEVALWQVDATLRDNGDLLIMSGGLDDEWHCTVPAAHLPLLLEAIMKEPLSASAIADAVNADARLLKGLSCLFAGDRNPYDDIIVFLKRHAIPMTTFVWTGTVWDDA